MQILFSGGSIIDDNGGEQKAISSSNNSTDAVVYDSGKFEVQKLMKMPYNLATQPRNDLEKLRKLWLSMEDFLASNGLNLVDFNKFYAQ